MDFTDLIKQIRSLSEPECSNILKNLSTVTFDFKVNT